MTTRITCCAICGGHEADVGPLSRRYRCVGCGTRAAVEAAEQMAAKSGPAYERWLATAGPTGRPETPEGGSRGPSE